MKYREQPRNLTEEEWYSLVAYFEKSRQSRLKEDYIKTIKDFLDAENRAQKVPIAIAIGLAQALERLREKGEMNISFLKIGKLYARPMSQLWAFVPQEE